MNGGRNSPITAVKVTRGGSGRMFTPHRLSGSRHLILPPIVQRTDGSNLTVVQTSGLVPRRLALIIYVFHVSQADGDGRLSDSGCKGPGPDRPAVAAT